MNTIEEKFNTIAESSLFWQDGKEIDLVDALSDLATAIAEEETSEETWWLGESGEFALSDLIVAAYWACVDCHGGQWSRVYALQGLLGQTFSPGMGGLDSEQDHVKELYETLCAEFLKVKA